MLGGPIDSHCLVWFIVLVDVLLVLGNIYLWSILSKSMVSLKHKWEAGLGKSAMQYKFVDCILHKILSCVWRLSQFYLFS